MGVHAAARHKRDSARSYTAVIRFAWQNSTGGGKRWRFGRDRFACMAGRDRKICRDGFDRRARAKKLRFISSAAARTRRTGPRHNRDASLPCRPRVGRKRLMLNALWQVIAAYIF